MVGLGARVRREREVRGWRLIDLASRSGLSIGTIRRIEADEDVLLESVKKVATAFGTTAAELLREDDAA